MMKLNTLLTSLIILATLACGREEPHGETQGYISLNRTMYVTAGKDNRGYCVYTRDREDQTVLVTTKGALSADQLGQSLSYMSYWAQMASAGLPMASYAYGVVFLKKSLPIYEQSMVDKGLSAAGRRKLIKLGVGGLVLVGATSIVNGIFRIIKGFYEGEDVGPIAAQFFFSWMPFNFLVEDLQRRGRVKALASEYERYSVSERRMTRAINKMAGKRPAFPDGCAAQMQDDTTAMR